MHKLKTLKLEDGQVTYWRPVYIDWARFNVSTNTV